MTTEPSITVLCVGDIMLDNFVYGHVGRISPEAPVPVLFKEYSSMVLGGVGNVARNIQSLGGHVILVGVIGDDEAGHCIQNLSKEFSYSFLIKDQSRKTTQKQRFCSQGQHLLRVDSEDTFPFQGDEEIFQFCKTIQADIVILSDYGKGVLTKELCQKLIQHFTPRIPVLVDPKGLDFSKYKGATILTPNEKEFRAVTNCFSLKQSAHQMRSNLNLDTIVITCGPKGMLVISEDESFEVKSNAKEVCDVSGAGDTAIATLAYFLGKKESLVRSTHLANTAAGIVVGKAGTATVTLPEIYGIKNYMLKHVTDLVDFWRQEGLSIGFTNGCFDLLHLGHIFSIQQAAKHCDRLIVGVNSDSSVKSIKGPTRPIQDEKTRASILSNLRDVSAVVLFEEETPLKIIQELKPDMIFKGKDYLQKKIVGSHYIESYGGQVILLDLYEDASTTKTISKINGRAPSSFHESMAQ